MEEAYLLPSPATKSPSLSQGSAVYEQISVPHAPQLLAPFVSNIKECCTPARAKILTFSSRRLCVEILQTNAQTLFLAEEGGGGGGGGAEVALLARTAETL